MARLSGMIWDEGQWWKWSGHGMSLRVHQKQKKCDVHAAQHGRTVDLLQSGINGYGFEMCIKYTQRDLPYWSDSSGFAVEWYFSLWPGSQSLWLALGVLTQNWWQLKVQPLYFFRKRDILMPKYNKADYKKKYDAIHLGILKPGSQSRIIIFKNWIWKMHVAFLVCAEGVAAFKQKYFEGGSGLPLTNKKSTNKKWYPGCVRDFISLAWKWV